MWWFQQGLSFLPVLLVVWTSAAFVFAYITAVVLRHVDPLLPYISDTGTTAPERCVFGIMLDVSSFLGLCTVYVRYKQVEALFSDSQRLNLLGLFFGCVSSFGMCVVANFQKTALFPVHVVGAILTFGVGSLYVLVQTLVSFRMQPQVHSKSQFQVRLVLTLWTFGSSISMFVSSVIMYSSLPGVDVAHKLHWTPGETGYTAHLVSTVSEWSLAFSFISFFLTFIRDFQKIELRAETVVQSSHLYDEPPEGAVFSPAGGAVFSPAGGAVFSPAGGAAAGETSPLLGGAT